MKLAGASRPASSSINRLHSPTNRWAVSCGSGSHAVVDLSARAIDFFTPFRNFLIRNDRLRKK